MKKIKGYEYYYISKEGRVFSDFTGELKRLKTQISMHGYEKVKLKTKIHTIHRLVATYFIDNPDDLPQVNHIDGDKLNNDICNLEWCNNSYNQKHAWDVGLQPKRVPINISLTLEQANEVRRLYLSEQLSHRKLASRFNVSKSTITDILNGKYYNQEGVHTHISRPKSQRKLTISQADEIREMYRKENPSFNSIGRLYGINHKTVKKIIENKSYINKSVTTIESK